MKACGLFTFVALLFFAGALAAQDDPSSIMNFLRVDDRICTGGQPTMPQLEALKAQGVKAVINLRLPAEFNAAEEQAKVKQLGMRYVNTPINRDTPTENQVKAVLKALRDQKNQPAFVHCHTANRVGALWMIHRVLDDGWTLDKAEVEAQKIGMRAGPGRDFALAYIAKHKR